MTQSADALSNAYRRSQQLGGAPVVTKPTPTNDHERVQQMRKAYEIRVTEKWRRALRHLEIKDNLFPNHKEEIVKYYPFSEYTVAAICQGHFIQRRLEKIVLEVVTFEATNQCYHAKMRDLAGDEIYGTFHSDCRELFKKNRCRKGTVIVLKDVSAFKMTNGRYYLVLVSTCLDRIC